VQDDLAAQVVADLDRFLVFVGRLVDLIVALGLEEEVARLAAHHGNQPADEGRLHRIGEHHHVGDQKAAGAQEVQRLIDAAVMIVAVVVPSLSSQFLEKLLHAGSIVDKRRNRHEANI